MLRQDVLPELGLYPLAQLKRSDLSASISKTAADLKAAKRRGTAANRLRAVLSKFCCFCEEQCWLQDGLGVRLPRPVVEKTSDRILSSEEAGALWSALQELREGHGATFPVQGWLGSLCLELERELFGQEYHSSADLREMESMISRIQDKLLPMLERCERMLKKALQQLESRSLTKIETRATIGCSNQPQVIG